MFGHIYQTTRRHIAEDLDIIIIIIIQCLKNFRPNGKLVLCHGCMASHRVAVGGEGFQIREVASSILNKPVSGGPAASGWEGGGGISNPYPKESRYVNIGS